MARTLKMYTPLLWSRLVEFLPRNREFGLFYPKNRVFWSSKNDYQLDTIRPLPLQKALNALKSVEDVFTKFSEKYFKR